MPAYDKAIVYEGWVPPHVQVFVDTDIASAVDLMAGDVLYAQLVRDKGQYAFPEGVEVEIQTEPVAKPAPKRTRAKAKKAT